MPTERLTIRGDLGADTFLPWIDRHLGRLGLSGAVRLRRADVVKLDVTGPTELIDAMAVGVSLGPIEAWIETVARDDRPADSI
jgi:hypothetical protein